MYGGNYAGPYQGAPDQMATAPVGQYQAPQQPMPGQQPMGGQPQQPMPGQQPMMGQPQQPMPGQQPMMDQQPMPDGPGMDSSSGSMETKSVEKGNTWMIVTILAGVGIAAVLAALIMLFLGKATTEVDVPSILLLVASICGIACLAHGLMYNSGKFAVKKMVPGSTGVLACLISGGAIGMGFSDLETSAYVLIVAALAFLVGGVLGFLAKTTKKNDSSDEADDSLDSFLSEQPVAPEQQFPGQQPMMDQSQQFPGQQPMPGQQQPQMFGAPPQGGAYPPQQPGAYPPYGS
ncbi:MAG: hypothetical protein QF682_12410 [Candidatus Thermoplasmatota archaeon]|nr:hypothetical protein [Candidatus Thermoplasmatota archaeon]